MTVKKQLTPQFVTFDEMNGEMEEHINRDALMQFLKEYNEADDMDNIAIYSVTGKLEAKVSDITLIPVL